jgi:hypothetical protein
VVFLKTLDSYCSNDPNLVHIVSEPQPTSRLVLRLRFLGGLLYLAAIAAMFSAATEIAFVPMLLAVVCGALFACGLALVWAFGTAIRDDIRPRQFGISSLMFLTVYVALYFGVVRWLAIHIPNAADDLPFIAGFCLALAVISIPVLILWTESLVWMAVWTVRRDCVQSWLSRRRSRTGRQLPGK